MQFIILLCGLIFLLFCSIIVLKNSIIHPSNLFIGMFLISTTYLFGWSSTLNTSIEWNTVCIILGGCILFFLFSNVSIGQKDHRLSNHNVVFIHYSNEIAWLFVIVGILAIILYMTELEKLVGMYIDVRGLSLSGVIRAYDRMSKFTTKNVRMPVLIKILAEVICAEGYIFGYILINNCIANGKKELKINLLINIILSLAMPMFYGGRAHSIRLILALLIDYIILFNRKNGSYKFNKRSIFILGLSFLSIIISFQWIGNIFLGRNNHYSMLVSLLMYMGGPIKNFDVFINSSHSKLDLWGQVTFMKEYRVIGQVLKIDKYVYDYILPFNKCNSFNLGNTYTLFYSYIYDFGILFANIIVSFMALFSGFLYKLVIRNRTESSKIDMFIVFYSFYSFLIMMSCFSEQFLGVMFSVQFWRYIVYFLVINQLLTRITFTRK